MQLVIKPRAGLAVIIKAKKDWKGKIVFDIQRHKHYMGKQLHDGLELKLKAAERITLRIEPI